MAVEFKTLFTRAFFEEAPPTRFLKRLFKTEPEYIFAGKNIQIDKVRNKEEYAVEVTEFTGGRPNKFNIYTRKEYSPPMFDEYDDITAEDLDKVMPGRTKYEMDDGYAMDFADMLVNAANECRNKIERGLEVYCRNALFFGQITLINGSIIDYNLRTSHTHDIVTPWTSSGSNALTDFVVIGKAVRADGIKQIQNAVFGSTLLQEFLNNDAVKELGRMEKIDRVAITSPMSQDDGAEYHGTFSAGDYKINIWSYPQQVGVPVGFGLPNEGDKVPYVPDDYVLVIPNEPDFRCYFAGVPSLINVDPRLSAFQGLPQIPALVRGEFIPYATLGRLSVRVGVRSKPLPIPVAIDEVGVIKKP